MMNGKWWEAALKKYEPSLPKELQKDWEYVFAHLKNESDDEESS